MMISGYAPKKTLRRNSQLLLYIINVHNLFFSMLTKFTVWFKSLGPPKMCDYSDLDLWDGLYHP